MKMFRGSKTHVKIALMLAGCLVEVLPSPGDIDQEWSADLSVYGSRRGLHDGRNHIPLIRVAATSGVVAIAWENPPKASPGEPDNRFSDPWEVTLLLFDANNGKLKKKGGPWRSAFSFELYPTMQGNFLLLLRRFKDAKQSSKDILYLLSSSGDELKKLDLSPSVVNSIPHWNEFLVSSSGSSVLVGQILEDGTHYWIVESSTLETKFEWTRERGSDSPLIVALSDKELLGFREPENQEKLRRADAERDLYVRKFDGPWRRLPVSFDVSSHSGIGQGLHPTQLAFLSDTVLVGVNAKRKDLEGSIVVLQSDGTIPSPVIPKLPERTSVSGPIAVSATGHYFAVGFQHQPWISHLLLDVMTADITFWNDDSLFLVWEASDPEPVARIPTGTALRAVSFSPNDPPTLAFVAGSTLEVIRFQSRANASKTH
jgi:hypothetical protein